MTAAGPTASAPWAQRLARAVESRRIYRDISEIALVALAFLLYFIVRGQVHDDYNAALDNARQIIGWERQLGIYWEPRLQDWTIDSRVLVEIANFVYFWLDFPLIVALGFWFYATQRHTYTVVRDALLLSGAIALLIYFLYPVMPPRLLPGDEFVGTIEKYNDLSYQASSTEAFVNPYAAVPSLHFGWAMILGGAMFVTLRPWPVRLFGLALPWLQLAAIVVTANHYILDAFAGLVVCLAGVALAFAAQRWAYPWIRARFGAAARPDDAQPGPVDASA